MRTTQQLSITLPIDMADAVKTKVLSGEYATESEVIRDGLRALLARDRAVESWLHDQVGPAYDALKADPSRAGGVRPNRRKFPPPAEVPTTRRSKCQFGLPWPSNLMIIFGCKPGATKFRNRPL